METCPLLFIDCVSEILFLFAFKSFISLDLWKFPMLLSLLASLNVFYFREIFFETQQ